MGKPVRVQVPFRLPNLLLKSPILAFFRARSISNSASHEENINLPAFNLKRILCYNVFMYNSELLKELVKRINRLTTWLNVESIVLTVSLTLIIVGTIIVINNWKMGHETADELSRLIIGENMLFVSMAVSFVMIITFAMTAAARKDRINELARLGVPVGYNRVNVVFMALPFVPACIVIVALLVWLLPAIFR